MEIESGKYDFDDAQPWAIVLAGGEGERLKPAVCRWLGEPCPKQYCTFLGNRSMLGHTWHRCRTLTSPDRVITIIGAGHRRFLQRIRPEEQTGRIIEQPVARGTLPGLLLPLTYLMATNPRATVFVFPSDHFVFPEERFLRFVRAAGLIAACRPDRMVLLGAIPEGAESDYGWIQGEAAADGSTRVHRISHFSEKPSRRKARQLYKSGGFWNTMVFASRARFLWDTIEQIFPEMILRFDLLRRVLRAVRMGRVTPSMEQVALHHIYDSIGETDLCRDLLQRIPEKLLLVPLEGVEWSDWGRPARIDESLRRLGRRPIFEEQPAEALPAARPFGVPVGQAVAG
ncbi:MAG: sugar phosphate nucleotidyltransferase [Acidobacteriota bacterium]